MGLHAIQSYLAILEVETYFQQHYPGSGVDLPQFQLPASRAGSPTSVEYIFDDIRGPALPNYEMHLQKLHF